MSLNAAEIDLVLSELEITGGHPQKVIQSDFKNLYISIYTPPRAWWLRIVIEHPYVRFHRSSPPRSKRSHQRFEDFLHATLIGAEITAVEHVFRDRIVRFTFCRAGVSRYLYLRLWGTRANVIVTEADGTILDAMLRKPKEGIASGETFVPAPPERNNSDRPVRPRREGRSFNEQIAEEYGQSMAERDRDRLVTGCRRSLEREISRLEARLAEIEQGRRSVESVDRFRHYGDLIYANMYLIETGADHLDVEDYEDGMRRLRIPLDPLRSPAENAQQYYERSKKSKESSGRLDERASNLKTRLQAARESLGSIENLDIDDLRTLKEDLRSNRDRSRGAERESGGLRFNSSGFEIIVGRNAKENDHLLRRAVRGNDWWLHARDVPGGYVFIKNKPGKSIPLEVLLDAGNLALFFSKGRSAGSGDLYYTQVKYLRRAKNGPLGLVLPTQEKNIAVTLEEDRLRRLGIGAEF